MKKSAYIAAVLLMAAALTGCRRNSPAAPGTAGEKGTATVENAGDAAAGSGRSQEAKEDKEDKETKAGRKAGKQAEKQAKQAGRQSADVAEKIEFKGLENFSLHGLSGVDIEVRVANNTNMRLTLDKLNFAFRLDGQALASGFLSQPVELEKKSESVVFVPLKIKIDNPLAVLSAVSAFRSDASRITVSGTGTVKAAGVVKKDIEIKDLPLDKLLDRMGVSREAVLEKIKL